MFVNKCNSYQLTDREGSFTLEARYLNTGIKSVEQQDMIATFNRIEEKMNNNDTLVSMKEVTTLIQANSAALDTA